jgi:threonine/homoserine/homoserine lactone efflux protein
MMPTDLLFAFILFAFAASITPGPNNVMLLASGANFGFVRTIPHGIGVVLGFGLMVFAIGWGLGRIFEVLPVLYTVLRWAGAAYLLWLAWKIGCSGAIGEGEARGKPFTFWQAIAFQWINPKAWVMALGAVTTYTTEAHYIANVMVVAGTFTLVGVPCSATWAGLGVALKRFLDRPAILRAFNITMASLLVLSLYPLFEEIRG